LAEKNEGEVYFAYARFQTEKAIARVINDLRANLPEYFVMHPDAPENIR
jgi:hypothetical protein